MAKTRGSGRSRKLKAPGTRQASREKGPARSIRPHEIPGIAKEQGIDVRPPPSLMSISQAYTFLRGDLRALAVNTQKAADQLVQNDAINDQRIRQLDARLQDVLIYIEAMSAVLSRIFPGEGVIIPSNFDVGVGFVGLVHAAIQEQQAVAAMQKVINVVGAKTPEKGSEADHTVERDVPRMIVDTDARFPEGAKVFGG